MHTLKLDSLISFISLTIFLFLTGSVLSRKPFNVSYDHRAIKVDGQRRILVSAGIHYPRAIPEMWPGIIEKAKDGGADVIETYVFWNGHEPVKGKYYFSGRYDLIKFVKLVEDAGLYLLLRIGPYICAEWNFGGFPVWLRDIPGIEFRTHNPAFEEEMARFVSKIVDLLKEERLFSWQGGPIILAQIENEYGNIERSYGENGRHYVKWAARMAEDLDVGIPWVMCQQSDAPSNIINACNGFYCDGFKPNAHDKPIMWTEDWNGWYASWGDAVPQRPAEDIAFAVARFFQRGGSFQNYYMYYGGTNFGHTSGGPFIATSYDYDAPIDEYGLLRQPKWGHLRDLHAAVKLCEPALISVDEEPLYIRLGPNQEAHIYTKSLKTQSLYEILQGAAEPCAAFLANIDSRTTARVHFNNMPFDLPPWSVSILPDCKHVVFNTAKVTAQTSLMKMSRSSVISDILHLKHVSSEELGQELSWSSYRETVGVWGDNKFSATSLLEHLNLTKDMTDYLWYICRVQIPEDDARVLKQGTKHPVLYIHAVRDMVYIFVNGKLQGSAHGSWVTVEQSVILQAGWNEIAILSITIGLQNYGAFIEKDGAGIRGPVRLQGLTSGDKDLTSIEWIYQAGFKGEFLKIFTKEGEGNVEWFSSIQEGQMPLTWHKATFDAPKGNDPIALDLGSMNKGEAWINGNSLGRYWPALYANTVGCTETCDYRGTYSSNKCLSGCGQPTQRWYHLPRAWLQPQDNLLVMFEEVGGDPAQVSVVSRTLDKICAHVTVSESVPVELQTQKAHLTKIYSTESNAQMHLHCNEDQHIYSIVFASFGDPHGKCGNFQQGSCHVANTSMVVETLCIGRNHCSLTVKVDEFGQDPCPDVTKSLAVEAVCRHSNWTSEQIFLSVSI